MSSVRHLCFVLIAGLMWVGLMAPAARAEPVQSAATCPSKCLNGFSLGFASEGGRCVVKSSSSCFPSTCDASFGLCRAQACTRNSDCAPGAGCNVGLGTCAPVNYTCSDAFTILQSTGSTWSCSPYKCNAGACQATCSAPGDCAPGSQCTGGRCVAH